MPTSLFPSVNASWLVEKTTAWGSVGGFRERQRGDVTRVLYNPSYGLYFHNLSLLAVQEPSLCILRGGESDENR